MNPNILTTDTNIVDEYVYHYCSIPNTKIIDIIKHGICSPGHMEEKIPDVFIQHIIPKYRKRAARTLGVDVKDIKGKHILKYIDTCSEYSDYCHQYTIYFSFLPFEKLPNKMFPGCKQVLELKVSRKILNNMQPILITAGATARRSNWKYLNSKDFNRLVLQQASRKIDTDDPWRNMSSLAVSPGKVFGHMVEETRVIKL